MRSLTDAVVDVALGLDIDNPEACECVAETALILNADAAARLAPRLATFLTQPPLWALSAKARRRHHTGTSCVGSGRPRSTAMDGLSPHVDTSEGANQYSSKVQQQSTAAAAAVSPLLSAVQRGFADTNCA